MSKGILTLIGFLLVGLGFFTLILGLIGINLTFLTWMDAFGKFPGFLLRIFMIVFGLIMVYILRGDFKDED